MPDAENAANPLCDKSAQISHISPIVNKTVPAATLRYSSINRSQHNIGLIRRVLDLFAPYLTHNYPGKTRLRLSYTPGYSYEAVKTWMRGTRRIPVAVCRYWADRLETDAASRLALAAELRAEADRLAAIPRKPAGFTLRRRKRLQPPVQL